MTNNVYTPINSSYQLVFDDEFNGTSLNTNLWSYGFGSSGGLTPPVNSTELEDYNSSQVSVSGGDLQLSAIATQSSVDGASYNYQSGMIGSDQTFTYGYYEARIYTPAASPGVIANWPAWWLDGQNWPTDGEIDTMEGLGGQAASGFHDAQNIGDTLGQSATGDFTGWHIYGVLWTPGELQFYYDGTLQHTVTTGVTSSPMQLLLNYAVGSYGGPVVAPATMLVDYVHVYQTTQYDPNLVAVTPQAGYGGPGDTGSGTVTSTPPPAITTIGSGPDTLALQVSEQEYLGNAQFTVSVDGTQIGGTQTATALHSSGQTQTFDVLGSFSAGSHVATIDFLNAASGGSSSLERNLYVAGATIDGNTVPNSALNEYTQGPQSFNFIVPGPITTIGSGSDTLALQISEDAYRGNAKFTVSVDGKQIGGTQTATALHSAGQSQTFDVLGNFAVGNHTATIDFLNDAYGGSASEDRNLYVTSATINGTAIAGAVLNEYHQGPQSFGFTEQ